MKQTVCVTKTNYWISSKKEYSYINKHGVSAYIDGATTVWAAANPINGQFEYLPNGKIDRNCVNISPPWMDRFDLVFIISDENNDANLSDYIHKKSLMIQNGEQLETPEWIIKYIAHVRTLTIYLKSAMKLAQLLNSSPRL